VIHKPRKLTAQEKPLQAKELLISSSFLLWVHITKLTHEPAFHYTTQTTKLVLSSPFCVRAAMAIETAVFCANPAGFFEAPLKLLPSPMKPHVKIAPANPEARGHRIGRFFIQIYALQQDRILRRH
jgi:hypothetical protein